MDQEKDPVLFQLERQTETLKREYQSKMIEFSMAKHNMDIDLNRYQIKTEESFVRVNRAQESLAKSQESLNKTFEMYLQTKLNHR
jgi:hypothetical protein